MFLYGFFDFSSCSVLLSLPPLQIMFLLHVSQFLLQSTCVLLSSSGELFLYSLPMASSLSGFCHQKKVD